MWYAALNDSVVVERAGEGGDIRSECVRNKRPRKCVATNFGWNRHTGGSQRALRWEKDKSRLKGVGH